jgi:iron complex outermembrane receptor protein
MTSTLSLSLAPGSAIVASATCAPVTAAAVDTARRHFELASGDAAYTLQRFSEVSGSQIVYLVDAVRGVTTNAVSGNFTPCEAIVKIMANTPLVVLQDQKTGAIMINRVVPPSPAEAPPSADSNPRSASEKPPKFARPRTLLALLTSWLALPAALAPAMNAADGSPAGAVAALSASVSGRVSNAATGGYLDGVKVAIQGTGRQVVTDREGRYVLAAPTGQVMLEVSYTGLDTQYIPVTLQAGATTAQDIALSAKIYQLEKFVVEGEREGNALAVTRQRQAANLKNVVAGDAFGTMTDDNVGQFLQKLPGINIISDTGLARQVMVRGIDASLNTVQLDGVQLANTNSSGVNRFFDFLQVSLSNVESIEVTKAPTPDMPASSIGGSVNMVTRTAFNRANPRVFTYSLGVVHKLDRIGGGPEPARRWYEEPIDGITPSVSFSFSDVVGARKNLGISLSHSRNTQFGGSQAARFTYQTTMNRPAYIRNVNLVLNGVAGPHTRENTNVKLEFKPDDRTLFTLAGVYTRYHEAVASRTQLIQTQDSSARFLPGYSELFSEAPPNINNISQLTQSQVDNVTRNYRLQSTAEHRLPGLTLDYSGTVSMSTTHADQASEGRSYPGQPKGVFTIGGLTNIGFSIDRRADPAWPIVRQTAGADMYDLDNYRTLSMNQNNNSARSLQTEARFSARKNLELAVPAFAKAGVQYQEQRRKRGWRQPRRYTFVGPGGLGQFADQSSFTRETVQGQRQAPWADELAVSRHIEDFPASWQEDISAKYVDKLRNIQDFKEAITSLYLMNQVQLAQLGILAGIRVEQTDTAGNGPVNKTVNREEAARRAAFVGTLTEEEIKRRAEYDWGTRAHAKGRYRNVFPGIHFKYSHRSNVVARASYSTSIGRPTIASIIPNTVIDENAERLTINNAGLKPQQSDNWDLSLEYYFEPVGVFSAGVFLKEVRSFIFQDSSQLVASGPTNGYDGRYEGYRIVTSSNGGSARYRGFELNYQQQLSFLPGFWSGFGLNLNYTQLETKGDYGAASGIATTQVAGFRPKTANVTLNYRRGKFGVSLQTNWLGTYLTTVSTNAASLEYESPRLITAAKVTYALTPRTSLYCNWDNVFGEPEINRYRGYEDRVSNTSKVYSGIAAGFQGRF